MRGLSAPLRLITLTVLNPLNSTNLCSVTTSSGSIKPLAPSCFPRPLFHLLPPGRTSLPCSALSFYWITLPITNAASSASASPDLAADSQPCGSHDGKPVLRWSLKDRGRLLRGSKCVLMVLRFYSLFQSVWYLFAVVRVG